jgi:hypothetical protein
MKKGKYQCVANNFRIQQEDSDGNDFGSDILVEENTALAEEYEKTASVKNFLVNVRKVLSHWWKSSILHLFRIK